MRESDLPGFPLTRVASTIIAAAKRPDSGQNKHRPSPRKVPQVGFLA
jgi:hypothetical protein